LCCSGAAERYYTRAAGPAGGGKAKVIEQVFCFTQSRLDINDYCEKAKRYDYTWFDMQHSTLEFKDAEAMIAACPHAGAIPMYSAA
jgi:hypothetical protein